MASRSIDDLHPQLAYAFGMAKGRWASLYPNAPEPFLSSTFRDGKEQDSLFGQLTDRRDNDGDGKIDEPDEFVTNARAGQSAHNYWPSLACDVAFKKSDKSLDWSDKWFNYFAALMLEQPNITWGGNFKKPVDRPHFELTDWKTRIGKDAHQSANNLPTTKVLPMPAQVPPVKDKIPPPPPAKKA